MPTSQRVHRRLSIEELEPRIAPTSLDLELTRTTNSVSQFFTDSDGDYVRVTLTGKAGVGKVHLELGGSGDIVSTEFQNANTNTNLEIVIQTPSGGNATPAGDVDGNSFLVGGLVVQGGASSITGNEFRNLRFAGDVAGPVSLTRISGPDVFEARSIPGVVDVQNWTGGTFSLTGDLGGLLNGDKGILGAILIAGDMLSGSSIAAGGRINRVEIGGNLAANASIQSTADITSVTVKGSGGFLGSLEADGAKGIGTLGVSTGDLGGAVLSAGPIKVLNIAGDILGGTVIRAAANIDKVSVGGSLLDGAVVGAGRNIGSAEFKGPNGIQGALTAGTTLGTLSIPNGPLSGVVSVGTAGSITGPVTIGGDITPSGSLVDSKGKTTSVNIGGSLLGQFDLEGGIGGLTVGDSVAALMDMTGDIGVFSVSAANPAGSFNSSQITIRGSVGKIDGQAQLPNTASIHITKNLGQLSLGEVEGAVTVDGAIKGGITVHGNFSGTISAGKGPIAGPLTVEGDFEQGARIYSNVPAGGVASRITIFGNLLGVLDVTQGNTGGPISIGGDIGPSGVIQSTGTLRRPITVGGDMLGQILVQNAMGTRDVFEAHNDTPARAFPIPISATAGNAVAGDISVPGEVDFFKFQVTGSARVGVQLNFAMETLEINSALQPQLTLLRSDGVTIVAQDAFALNHHVFLNQTLLPGTYYLRVQALAGTVGTYNLFVNPNGTHVYEREGPEFSFNFAPGTNPLNAAQLGQVASAAQFLNLNDNIPTSVSGAIGQNTDIDVYEIYVTVPPISFGDTRGNATAYNFTVSMPYDQNHQKFLFPYVGIYDRLGTAQRFVAITQTGTPDAYTYFEFTRTDFYYVTIQSSNTATNGPYNLNISKTPRLKFNPLTFNAADPGAPPEVEQNELVKGATNLNAFPYIGDLFKGVGGIRIRNASMFMPNTNPFTGVEAPPDGDRDFYAFRAVAGQEMTFKVSRWNVGSPLPNSILRVYDSSGTLMAANNDLDFGNGQPFGTGPSADMLSALTVRVPKTGVYVVEVHTPFAGSIPAFGGYGYLGTGFTTIYGLGNYELLITEGSVWQPDAQSLNLNAKVGLGAEPVLVHGAITNPGEDDYYQFTVNANDVISFGLHPIAGPGGALDGKLQILDSNNEILLETNHLFGVAQNTADPNITYKFPVAGSYVVTVLGDTAITTGDYNLFLTKKPAHIAAPITITGNLDGIAGPGTGVISAPGSLLAAVTVGGNVLNNALVQLGLDLSAPLQINGSLGDGVTGAALWAGGYLRSNGYISVGAEDGIHGTIFTRGVQGAPGQNAPLRFNGTLDQSDPNVNLVVAPAGGLTGKAKVVVNNEILTPGLRDVTLYNLDDSGHLSGLFAAVFYNPTLGFSNPTVSSMVYRANRDFSAITPHGPSDVNGAFSQVEVYWQINQYYSYLSYIGYPQALARVNSAIVDTDPLTILANSAYYDPMSQGMEFGTFVLPTYQPDPAAHMGDIILHELNHGVTDAMVANHLMVGYPGYLTVESGSAQEGLSDYRTASFLNEPRVGMGATGFPNDRITDNFYHYDANNLPVANTLRGQHWAGRFLSGALWDLRNARDQAGNLILGQEKADALSLRMLEVLDRIISDTRGWAVGHAIDVTFNPAGNVGSVLQVQNIQGILQQADQELYGGVHAQLIQEALALHGLANFNFSSPFPYYITAPNEANAVIERTYTIAGALTLNVTFDNLVTKIEQGEHLIIRDGADNIVLDYTPDYPFPPGIPDYGRALQEKTVVVPGETVKIYLVTDQDTNFLGEQNISFGFLVTSITAGGVPPGPPPVIPPPGPQQQIQYLPWNTTGSAVVGFIMPFSGGGGAPMGTSAPVSLVGAGDSGASIAPPPVTDLTVLGKSGLAAGTSANAFAWTTSATSPATAVPMDVLAISSRIGQPLSAMQVSSVCAPQIIPLAASAAPKSSLSVLGSINILAGLPAKSEEMAAASPELPTPEVAFVAPQGGLWPGTNIVTLGSLSADWLPQEDAVFGLGLGGVPAPSG